MPMTFAHSPRVAPAYERQTGIVLTALVFAILLMASAAAARVPYSTVICEALLVCTLLLGLFVKRSAPVNFALLDCAAIAIGVNYSARLLLERDQVGYPQALAQCTGILLYFVVRIILRRRAMLRWATAFIGVCLGVAGVSWYVSCIDWIRQAHEAGFIEIAMLKASLPRPSLGVINEWAAIQYCGIVLQLAVLKPGTSGALDLNGIGRLMLFVSSATLFLTFSRGAYLAMAFLIVGAILYVVPSRSKAFIRLVIVAVLIISAGALASNTLTSGAVFKAAAIRSTEQQRRSALARPRVWSNSLDLMDGHWALGSGLGTFAGRYLPKADLGSGRAWIGRSLNTCVTLLVEQGIVGLTLHLFVILALFASALPALRRRPHDGRSWATCVLLLGLLGLWIKEMTFSSLTENRVVAQLQWLLIALAAGRIPDRCPEPSSPLRLAHRLGIVFLVLATVMVFYVERRAGSADRLAALATRSASVGDFRAASSQIDRAFAVRPFSYYRGLSALIWALQALPAFDSSRPFTFELSAQGGASLERALAEYDQAISAYPDDSVFLHNRAWVSLALGRDWRHAATDLSRAIEVDGGSPEHRVSLGLLFEEHGLPEKASEQYALALAVSPDLADSMFARDLRRRSEEKWRAALLQALGLLHRLDPMDRDALTRARVARLLIENGQMPEAHDALLSVTAEMPDLPYPWLNLARVYRRMNDEERADLCLRKASFLGALNGVVFRPTVGTSTPGAK
jgi:hypothetical protein